MSVSSVSTSTNVDEIKKPQSGQKEQPAAQTAKNNIDIGNLLNKTVQLGALTTASIGAVTGGKNITIAASIFDAVGTLASSNNQQKASSSGGELTDAMSKANSTEDKGVLQQMYDWVKGLFVEDTSEVKNANADKTAKETDKASKEQGVKTAKANEAQANSKKEADKTAENQAKTQVEKQQGVVDKNKANVSKCETTLSAATAKVSSTKAALEAAKAKAALTKDSSGVAAAQAAYDEAVAAEKQAKEALQKAKAELEKSEQQLEKDKQTHEKAKTTAETSEKAADKAKTETSTAETVLNVAEKAVVAVSQIATTVLSNASQNQNSLTNLLAAKLNDNGNNSQAAAIAAANSVLQINGTPTAEQAIVNANAAEYAANAADNVSTKNIMFGLTSGNTNTSTNTTSSGTLSNANNTLKFNFNNMV